MAQELTDLLPVLAKLSSSRQERRSLTDLARECGRSASSFQRNFSRLVGQSPKQFTRRLQLEFAAILLISSARSVLDIASEAGFESHEGFTRAFASHFKIAPLAFRKSYASLVDADKHTEILKHSGPCLTLYRRTSESQDKRLTKGKTMNYDITRQPIEACTFLYQQERCAHAEIAQTLGKLLPAVFEHAMKNGIEFTSPPTTLYSDWGPGKVTLAAGMMVKSASATDDFMVDELPACEALVTIHHGGYDSLHEAHAAIEEHLESQGLNKAGDVREVYLTDPGEVPDPKDWRTQLVCPVKT